MNKGNINLSREQVIQAAVIPQIIMLTISIIWIYISPKDNVLNYLKLNYLVLLYGVLTGAILAFIGYAVYKTAKRFNKLSTTIELFEKLLAPMFVNIKAVDIFSLSIVSAFCEEVLFRGLIQLKFGILISSIAFGMLHLPGLKYWIYAVWAALSGALFSYLFIFSGSLWLPITAHAVNNVIGMFLLKTIKEKQ